ncbi:MAG: hypothetical protein KF909_01265 [Rhodocyclaceae bacterium]|nr:hypothetical protein [Rhodocyclaceae bacterium]MCP5231543.1 hypothetical protein [Zoogloeaceae bacterium]MCB1911503.1 hypothetical protein [Rhodocyclaceae bacterium]MCP5254758.1 hypothetical protein [Zoogloeaceae bacterium]MCP5294390.1 hypothetical protein [Zoogloeaceae bacterium]
MTISSNEVRILDPQDISAVSGGIVERIEKGDEFDTIWDMITDSINKHLLFWDAPGTGWNKYP